MLAWSNAHEMELSELGTALKELAWHGMDSHWASQTTNILRRKGTLRITHRFLSRIFLIVSICYGLAHFLLVFLPLYYHVGLLLRCFLSTPGLFYSISRGKVEKREMLWC